MSNYRVNAMQGSVGGLLVTALLPAAHSVSVAPQAPAFESAISSATFRSSVETGSAVLVRNYEVSTGTDSDGRLMETAAGFYEELLANQEMLGKEFEEAIALGIGDLYEE